MTAIHVLPEIVLDGIDRHENEHHHVLWMMFQKVKSDRRPLPVDFFHFGEYLSAAPVRRHEPEEADVMINFAEMLNQLAFKRGRIDERTVCRWRIQAGDLEPIQRLRRIGKRNIHSAHGKPSSIE